LVGAIDLNRSEPDWHFGGSVNGAGGSRATWTGKPERVSEWEASESIAPTFFIVANTIDLEMGKHEGCCKMTSEATRVR